jgi:Nucleotidyl transferase AbiEii toxin, Type IV TA system
VRTTFCAVPQRPISRPAPLSESCNWGELAADIARHPRLSEALALKGGTPLNLGFGPPRRLSIDLDYNYVAQLDRDSMLAERPEIEAAVVQIAERQGFRVQTSAEAFAGRKLHLHYAAALDPAGVVQIAINYLHRLPLDAAATMALWQHGELNQPSVHAVGLSELLVGKLLALLDRGVRRATPGTLRTCRPPLAGLFVNPSSGGCFWRWLRPSISRCPATDRNA